MATPKWFDRTLAAVISLIVLLFSSVVVYRNYQSSHYRYPYPDPVLVARRQRAEEVLRRLGAQFSGRAAKAQIVDLSQWRGSKEHLANLTQVLGPGGERIWLIMTGSEFDDESLHHIKDARIAVLNLADTRVTDEGLRSLLPVVRTLDLSRTLVTDAGLAHLEGFRGLRDLNLTGTAVTEGAIAKLQQLLPNCMIVALPQAPPGGGLSP
jgi:hypothetical protein